MHIFYTKKLGRAWHQADYSLNEWAESTALVNPSVRLSPSSREKSDLSCPSHYPKIHALFSGWAGILESKINLTFIWGKKKKDQQQSWSFNFMIWLLRTSRYRASLSEGRQSQPVSSYIPIEDATVSNPSSSVLAIKDTSTALNQHSWFELEPTCGSMTIRSPNFHGLMFVISLSCWRYMFF